MTDNYKQAIADFLEIDIEDLKLEEHEHWGLEVYNGYAVGTDEEATEAAGKNIKDSLWSFRAEFLAEMTDIPSSVFEALQPQCENSNDAVRVLIEKTCGLEDFIESAIDSDGRGYYLASYDFEEHEASFTDEQSDEQTLYFYRID